MHKTQLSAALLKEIVSLVVTRKSTVRRTGFDFQPDQHSGSEND